jgi:hypothetical protein
MWLSEWDHDSCGAQCFVQASVGVKLQILLHRPLSLPCSRRSEYGDMTGLGGVRLPGMSCRCSGVNSVLVRLVGTDTDLCNANEADHCVDMNSARIFRLKRCVDETLD